MKQRAEAAGGCADRNERRLQRQDWRQILGLWRESGLSMQAFCRRHELSYHAFRYWKKRLSEKSGSAGDIFLPVVIDDRPRTRAGYEIVLDNGRIVRLGDDFSSRVLERLLSVVEGPSS